MVGCVYVAIAACALRLSADLLCRVGVQAKESMLSQSVSLGDLERDTAEAIAELGEGTC